METTDHLLVVDDDRQLLALLSRYLEAGGYRVSTAGNAAQMRAALAAARIDLIVLDLMLPGEDGLALCRDLRARDAAPIPILMLTARSEEADRIVGLEMGADDYLTKPFATRELLFGDWRLDTLARHLLDAQGTLVPLTGAEYRLLRVLLDRPQCVLNRDQLLNLTQGRDADAFDRSIDLLVSRLRRRLRDDSREPRYIKTVRAEGYVFCAEVRPAAAS